MWTHSTTPLVLHAGRAVFRPLPYLHVCKRLERPAADRCSAPGWRFFRAPSRTGGHMRSPLQLARRRCCNVACVRRAECVARRRRKSLARKRWPPLVRGYVKRFWQLSKLSRTQNCRLPVGDLWATNWRGVIVLAAPCRRGCFTNKAKARCQPRH